MGMLKFQSVCMKIEFVLNGKIHFGMHLIWMIKTAKGGGLGVSRVAGLANFCAWVSGISFKIPILSGFRGHSVHVVN